MLFQYNPYSTGQMQVQQQPQMQQVQVGGPAGNPYGAQDAFGNQNPEPKKFSVPTWLFWLLIIAFLGFAAWLWFWL